MSSAQSATACARSFSSLLLPDFRSRQIAGFGAAQQPVQLGCFLELRILLLRRVHGSDRRQKIDNPVTSNLPRRCKMSTTDEIAKEKQRVGEALALIDRQREKLAGQLA